MSITEKLNSIFRTVFDDEDIDIRPEMTSNDVDGWDSLSHINLLLAVEKGFDIRFTQKEILSFKNIGDLLSSISTKVA